MWDPKLSLFQLRGNPYHYDFQGLSFQQEECWGRFKEDFRFLSRWSFTGRKTQRREVRFDLVDGGDVGLPPSLTKDLIYLLYRVVGFSRKEEKEVSLR